MKTVVIGAGASGMMCAATACSYGAEVFLIERNDRCGRKLAITGKGRCNVTNACSRDEFLSAVIRNPRFLYSAWSAFSSEDTMAFFESLGVPLKVERGNRVFPVSDRAFDVSGALERRLRGLKVAIVRDRAVALDIADGAVKSVNGEKKSLSVTSSLVSLP